MQKLYDCVRLNVSISCQSTCNITTKVANGTFFKFLMFLLGTYFCLKPIANS